MNRNLFAHDGSIQNIDEIPDLKRLYRPAWEIPERTVLGMAADRGAFIDQSQSLNIHIVEPNHQKVSEMHFHGWKLGLKTGMYYLKTKPAANPIHRQERSSMKRKSAELEGEEEQEVHHFGHGVSTKFPNRSKKAKS
ncbi:ribonucleoside-diphosphate reductase large subunit-like [Festucalex cinctus]